MRRRRLVFRAWHRGTRELDLILGRFADEVVAGLDERTLADFEALMEVPDPDLFDWIVGGASAPANFETELLRQLRAFHRAGRGARES
jgi:antitoxin CptB